MRAAVKARQDPGLVIVGRSQAATYIGIEDAIVRARAYAQTGVDALFFTGVTTRDQLEALSSAVTLPLMLGTVNAALNDRAYLASKNVRIALQGHQPFAAAVQATYATLKALREGTTPGDLPNIAPKQLMDEVSRDADYTAWTKEFLNG
jgi:carboxyvinyl-carboxyphosphonate phosphorylmutase